MRCMIFLNGQIKYVTQINTMSVLPHFFFGFLERLAVVVRILVRSNDAFLMARDLGIEFIDLLLRFDRVPQFRHRTQESGSIHLQLVVLLAHSKLNGKEVQLYTYKHFR